MSTKSTVWMSKCEFFSERRKETVCIQSLPAGYTRDGEKWFSIETDTSEYLELPESKMREMVKSLSAELDGPKG